MDIQYCNGQKRYDFSTDEGFYYPGCDPKYYHIDDLSPKAFRRAYVKALFVEDKRWLTAIEKYQMVVPGSRKNKRDDARDQTEKELLREQVSPGTLEDRKAFYEARRDTACCADDCEDYCDKCPNKGVKFKPVPTFGLDTDVRRYITRYGRYQTTSELKEEEDARDKESTNTVLSGVCDGSGNNETAGTRRQRGDGLLGEPEKFPVDQNQGYEKGFKEGYEKMLPPSDGANLVT